MDNEEEFEDYNDEDPSDLGFDPYAGTYLDDDPVDPYEYEDEYYGDDYE